VDNPQRVFRDMRARWIGPYSGCTWTNIIYSWCKHWLRI